MNTVNPAHIKFKIELKDALGGIITKQEDLVIMVDDLVLKLQNKFTGVKGFERANILSTLSEMYGIKVQYMGKEKK